MDSFYTFFFLVNVIFSDNAILTNGESGIIHNHATLERALVETEIEVHKNTHNKSTNTRNAIQKDACDSKFYLGRQILLCIKDTLIQSVKQTACNS